MAINRCFCWSLKTGTFISLIYVTVASFVALIFVALDQADTEYSSMEIMFSFKTEWRMHVEKGFFACNIVMFFAHSIVCLYSLFLVIMTRYGMDHKMLRLWLFGMVCYCLVELGVSLYEFTWYGPNIWRLAYLVTLFLQWLVRLVLNLLSMYAAYGRLAELILEMKYGEKHRDDITPASLRGSTAILLRNPVYDKK